MESAFPLTGVATITPRSSSVEALVTEAAETHVPLDQTQPKSARSAFADRPGVEAYADWDQQAVSTFVTTSCDLPQYEATIKANNITGSQLREFRSHDMLNIGLLRAGICDHEHQRRISEEMLRVEQGDPDAQRQRLSQTVQDWREDRRLGRILTLQDWQKQRRPEKPVAPRASWDTKRREFSFGRLTTCYMPGNKEDGLRGRYMYGPRLDLTRTAKLMKREASCPAQLFSSETRKTMQLYDPRRHSQMAGAAASSRGLVKILS